MLGGQRHIYADDFELLHEGMQRLARQFKWTIIERPSEVDPEALPDPRIVTLEKLGLERLRPVPEPPAPPEVMACETCVHRNNATGDGPCRDCDLTFDGPESSYLAEADAPVVLNAGEGGEADQDLDAFAAQSAAGLPMSGTDEGAPRATEAIEDDEDEDDEDEDDEDEDEAAETDTDTET
jgi:hypothetical protein